MNPTSFIYDKPPPPPIINKPFEQTNSSASLTQKNSSSETENVGRHGKRRMDQDLSFKPTKRGSGRGRGRSFRGGSHAGNTRGACAVDGIEYLKRRNISINTPEEIEAWIQERKKNWPTESNIRSKQVCLFRFALVVFTRTN